MEFQNYQAIIDFAVEKEIEAASFYEQAAANESREETRQMFLDFAKEEQKHR